MDCVGGDFFESVPASGDAYLVSVVLHDWPDQQAQRILANIAAAGGSGARLLMLEFVVPPGDTPHLSKMSDLSMLVMMGGKERTETEWREPSKAQASPASKYARPAHHCQSSRQQCNSHATCTDQIDLDAANDPTHRFSDPFIVGVPRVSHTNYKGTIYGCRHR